MKLPDENPFATLGISVDKCQTDEQLKSAYLKACMKYHPDRPHGCPIQFKKVQEAYDFLKVPTNRLKLTENLANDKSYNSVLRGHKKQSPSYSSNNNNTNYYYNYRKPPPVENAVDPATMRGRNAVLLVLISCLFMGSYSLSAHNQKKKMQNFSPAIFDKDAIFTQSDLDNIREREKRRRIQSIAKNASSGDNNQ